MNLENKTLDEWLKDPPIESFYLEKSEKFYSRYELLYDFLKKKVYDQVNIGANLKDPDVLLNDHGIKHVEAVIEKASEIATSEQCNLTAYEVYILLLCILLHDVGIIFGRYKHEIHADKVLSKAENLCGEDMVETILIRKIIESHSGKIQDTEDKDKISNLLQKDKENSLKGIVRTHVIASILRFADELADDKRRAYNFLLDEGNVPKKSEVYHVYSSCLDSVFVKHEIQAVELTFKISKTDATRLFGNMDDKEILLIDEIYNRVLKMHLERIYCMRFLKGMLDIDKISVSIDFFDSYYSILAPLNFEVCESGYPKGNSDDLFSLCEPLKDMHGKKIDGKYIKNQIEKHDKKNIEVVSKPPLRPNSSIGGKISTAVTTIKAWCRGLKS
jgi:HD domain-containing protein